MLSGNGRHRRPRQAPAIIVAAGVTGSAIAIPLLAATGASAAEGTHWDKVAECESGGSWSASTGNGYYGGLQLSQDDWDKYGGLDYASSPDQASRSQQIAVAEKILADRGTAPWAACAPLAGLSAHSGSVDVDTGVPGSGSSHSHSSHSSGKSSDSSGSPDYSKSTGLSDSSISSDSPSDSPSASAGAQHGSPKSGESSSSGTDDAWQSDGSPTVVPESDDSDNVQQSAGSWNLVDTGAIGGGRHRGAGADESGTKSRSESSAGRHAYTVRGGDSLASIADSLDVEGGWRGLYAANKHAIGSDPNDIAPGQTLEVGA